MKDHVRDMALAGIGTIVAIVIMSTLWQDNVILAPLAAILAAVLLWFWHKTEDLLYFFSVFIVGTVGDIVAVNSGAWTYNNPTILGIPCWLPILWGVSALCLRRGIAGLVVWKFSK